jgi:hypothetical protein
MASPNKPPVLKAPTSRKNQQKAHPQIVAFWPKVRLAAAPMPCYTTDLFVWNGALPAEERRNEYRKQGNECAIARLLISEIASLRGSPVALAERSGGGALGR